MNSIMADNIVNTDHLFNELRQRFPEVPPDVVTTLMRQNSCNRVKCIEALGRESHKYLYNDFTTTPVSKFNQLFVNSPPSGSGYSGVEQAQTHDFRNRTDSTGSVTSVGSTSSCGPTQRTPGGQQSSSQYYTPRFQRPDNNYPPQVQYSQNTGYHQQQSQRHIQIPQCPPSLYNPSHQQHAVGQNSQQSHGHGGWVSVPTNNWVSDHMSYPSSQQTQYQPYQTTPTQRSYNNQESWPGSLPHNHNRLPPASRPLTLGFNEGYSLNNGEATGSPETPTSQTSNLSNTGTPSTPPVTVVTNLFRNTDDNTHPDAFNSHVLIPRLSPNLYENYDQMHPVQFQQPAAQSSRGQTQPIQSQTYSSHVYIPVPQTMSSNVAMRTPSPSQPPPNSGFYPPSSMRPAPLPPQSLPPFPLNQQRSSDTNSSPGTPQHKQFSQCAPQVFQGLQSPRSRQDHMTTNNYRSDRTHRVAFQIPMVTDIPAEPQSVHRNDVIENQYHVYKNSGGAGDNTLYGNAITRPGLSDPHFTGYPGSSVSGDGQFSGYSVGGPIVENRPRSGSIEESHYLQTLLEYQNQRKTKLHEDIHDSYRLLSKLQAEVSQTEKQILERKKSRTNFPITAEDVHKIRQVNRRLQIDIQLLTREIDLVNNGQTPLGILDTHQLQSFYTNIDTGRVLSTSRPSTPPPRPAPPRPRPHQLNFSTEVEPPPILPPRPPPEEIEKDKWNCSACTFLNHQDLDKCEMCEMPKLSGY